MDGQGEPKLNYSVKTSTLNFLTMLLALAVCAPAAHAEPRLTPSGQPVPRYISLKFDKVYARAGPSEDHKLLWVYHVKGLPVQVAAENSEWRRICGPDGGMAWVHKRLTSGENTVLRKKPTPLALHKKPKAEAAIIAYLNPRSMAALIKCEDGWCRVRADKVTGWAAAAELWGTSDAVQCKVAVRTPARGR